MNKIKFIKTALLLTILASTSIISGQTRTNSLNNSSIQISTDALIKDEQSAVKFAELILFQEYGEKKIKEERPYQISFADNCWTISGTLKKGWKGGTFHFKFDSRDCRIIDIHHEK